MYCNIIQKYTEYIIMLNNNDIYKYDINNYNSLLLDVVGCCWWVGTGRQDQSISESMAFEPSGQRPAAGFFADRSPCHKAKRAGPQGPKTKIETAQYKVPFERSYD